MTSPTHSQAEYWDGVADRIENSNAPGKDLVGYHSPWDLHVRGVAIDMFDRFSALVPVKRCVAELGSGTGLNLRRVSKMKPEMIIGFDCSSHLLDLARKNLSDLDNVQYVHTSSFDLPVPENSHIDLLFTLTVLQHIVKPVMFQSVVASMIQSGATHILVIEDTRRNPRQPTGDYTLRAPAQYIAAFAGSRYELVKTETTSLAWAVRFLGGMNKLFGLYNRPEGSRLPHAMFVLGGALSPLIRLLDRLLPGQFGMTAALFRLK
jgi:SAM-dependent methyltransferase